MTFVELATLLSRAGHCHVAPMQGKLKQIKAAQMATHDQARPINGSSRSNATFKCIKFDPSHYHASHTQHRSGSADLSITTCFSQICAAAPSTANPPIHPNVLPLHLASLLPSQPAMWLNTFCLQQACTKRPKVGAITTCFCLPLTYRSTHTY